MIGNFIDQGLPGFQHQVFSLPACTVGRYRRTTQAITPVHLLERLVWLVLPSVERSTDSPQSIGRPTVAIHPNALHSPYPGVSFLWCYFSHGTYSSNRF